MNVDPWPDIECMALVSILKKGGFMYLSEEKRAEIRKCLSKQKFQPRAKKSSSIKTAPKYKISQILFDARDGKEHFTPF